MTVTTATGLREGSTQLSTGIRIHHVDHGDPQGAPVVMLHGYSDSSFSFSQLMPLIDPAYRVHALDVRGHGNTDKPSTGYSIDDHADDVVAFLDASGIARVTVLGHSMGTTVARRVAEAYPDRVDALVMIGAVRTPVNDGLQELKAAVHALTEDDLPDFARDFQVSTVHAAMPAGFLDRVVEICQAVPLRVWRAAVDGLVAFDDAAAVSRIRARTLLLWGEHDAYFGREEQEWLAATIPDARLRTYASSGHNPHWEQPADVAAELHAFLDAS